MNWLLLRGLMRECRHWGNFPERMQALDKVDRIVCVDLPGVGTESGRMFIPNIKDVVRDVRTRFLQIENPTVGEWGVLGHSLGGMIAMQWANDFPQDFKKIVVMSSSSRDVPIWKRLKLYSMQKVVEIFLEKDVRLREKKIIQMISNLKKDDPKVLQEWVDIEKSCPLAKTVAVEQLLGAALFRLPKKVQPPMLVLASRADRMVDSYCSEYISKKFKAPLHIHPTSGHDLALDDGDWVLQKVNQWLGTF
jgi:pimeloyl-ACP methyl ester carboxylesterase